jgi:hypothetical protein
MEVGLQSRIATGWRAGCSGGMALEPDGAPPYRSHPIEFDLPEAEMLSPSLPCVLLAASVVAVSPTPAVAGVRVPPIEVVEARVTANALVVTARYADPADARTLEYAVDRDGAWGAQLYLAGPRGTHLVAGLECHGGLAPVLALELDPDTGVELGRHAGMAAWETRPYGLVTRVPLDCLAGALPSGYRLQLYGMRDLGPGYNHTVRAEFVTEYAGGLETTGRNRTARSMGAPPEPASLAAAGSASWGALKARYR